MAWQRTSKEVRPDTDTDFYVAHEDTSAHIRETYEDTGKSISFSISLSEDTLTKTKTRVFDTEASKNTFVADDVIVADRAVFAQHCTDNNTTKAEVTDEEI
jgi:hypothetical protein